MALRLPGPRSPAIFQSLQWMLAPPLRLTLALGARYGETFRLRVLAPAWPEERSTLPLVARTVLVVSRPEHLQEVFARSRDTLHAGAASSFISWHAGSDSVIVLDGEPHRAERHQMQSTLRSETILRFETQTRRGFCASLQSWPAQGTVLFGRLLWQAALDAVFTVLFGELAPDWRERLRSLVLNGAATTSIDPAVMVLPMLQKDLGPLSPGGRILRAREEFDRMTANLAGQRRAAPGERTGDFLGELLHLEETRGPGHPDRLIQRVRTMMSAVKTSAVAAVWAGFYVLQNPEVLARVSSAAREGKDRDYIEAACRETLRLTPPFLGGFRRVTVPLHLGEIECQPDTLIFPAFSLTHRRAELYPDPERFDPERFLRRSYAPWEYAPFGGGIRRCLGEPLALMQMRVILEELVREFEVRPVGNWGAGERRRHTMLFPRNPMRVVLRRRSAAG
jgi:cytochrome P450